MDKIVLKKLLKNRSVSGCFRIIKSEEDYTEFHPERDEWDRLKSEIVYAVISRHKHIIRVDVNYIERRYTIEYIG